MDTFVMLTRLEPGAVHDPQGFEAIGRDVIDRLRAECPDVRWCASYSVSGPYDYVDVFEAPDTEAATRVAMVLRSFGHANVEIWPATAWPRFKELARGAARRAA